jgi:hypothetical protein
VDTAMKAHLLLKYESSQTVLFSKRQSVTLEEIASLCEMVEVEAGQVR